MSDFRPEFVYCLNELSKIAAADSFSDKLKDVFVTGKRLAGKHLDDAAYRASSAYLRQTPAVRNAIKAFAFGAAPGAVSGAFDNRGNPSLGKRLKRAVHRGAKWGTSGAALYGLSHMFQNLGD